MQDAQAAGSERRDAAIRLQKNAKAKAARVEAKVKARGVVFKAELALKESLEAKLGRKATGAEVSS